MNTSHEIHSRNALGQHNCVDIAVYFTAQGLQLVWHVCLIAGAAASESNAL